MRDTFTPLPPWLFLQRCRTRRRHKTDADARLFFTRHAAPPRRDDATIFAAAAAAFALADDI